jgi:hypothetical protein
MTGRHDIDGLSHPLQVRLVRDIARVSGVRARRQSHETRERGDPGPEKCLGDHHVFRIPAELGSSGARGKLV